MDWIIKELQYKAGLFQETGQIIAFDPGVVKSDKAIPAELQQALREAIRPLENVPEDQKDYHPGSDNKVVDLVHPSLFPVVYGHTRILPDKIIGLDDCLHNVGQGELLPRPGEPQTVHQFHWRHGSDFEPFSRKFQWMPCDVEFTSDGECRIVSYINNLHPHENSTLYKVLEKILTRTIPLWNTTLTNVSHNLPRISYSGVEYLDHPEPEPKQEDGERDDTFWDRHGEWEKSRPIKQPEPGEFSSVNFQSLREVDELQKDFAESGLQVIVKLANIELTPEKPQYDGGSWHVEGQLVRNFDHLLMTKLISIERAHLRICYILL